MGKKGNGSKLESQDGAGLAGQGHMERECAYIFARVKFCAPMHPSMQKQGAGRVACGVRKTLRLKPFK